MRYDNEVNFSSLSYARVTFPQYLPEFFEHRERWVVRRREEEGIYRRHESCLPLCTFGDRPLWSASRYDSGMTPSYRVKSVLAGKSHSSDLRSDDKGRIPERLLTEHGMGTPRHDLARMQHSK